MTGTALALDLGFRPVGLDPARMAGIWDIATDPRSPDLMQMIQRGAPSW